MKSLRVIGIVLGVGMMILVGLLLPTFSTSVSAHAVADRPGRVTQVGGDYLGVERGRRGCVYTVHFTLTRQMRFEHHFRVTGPNHPVLLWVGRNEAVASYEYYNRNRCFPDRQHHAWQFVLIGY